ncbi:acyltransferase family protein [Paraburkholderia sp. RL17-347-BIC-D]|uniref:acyltransferase family protein n=1 Tax=Paraburkholderia sp. RL17-347-BIC-D TaxID=3031632 RepID=UPI0038BC609A
MKHNQNFDFLRVLAALIVIVGHSYSLVGLTQPTIFGMTLASYGVTIFFCISGYLISGSWMSDPSVYRYLAKRFLRIFPGLITVVLVTVFIAGPLLTTVSMRDYFASQDTGRYLLNAVMYINYRLDGVFEHNPYPYAVNGSLWSLPAEFAMYLIVPLAAGIPFRKSATVGLMILFCIVYVSLGHRNQTIMIYATELKSAAAMGSYFMGGVLLKMLGAQIRFTLPRAAIAFVAFALLSQFSTGHVQYLSAIGAAFAVPYVVVAVGLSNRLKLPNLAKYGDFSYGLYLYAFLIQQTLTMVFPGIHLGLEIALAIAFTLPCAVVSWSFVERRALRFKPSRPGKRQVSLFMPP